MKVFNYGQYIKCIHTFRLSAIMQLAEESAEYKLEFTKKECPLDKLLNNLLQDTRRSGKND